jgi:hypothetical protein
MMNHHVGSVIEIMIRICLVESPFPSELEMP